MPETVIMAPLVNPVPGVPYENNSHKCIRAFRIVRCVASAIIVSDCCRRRRRRDRRKRGAAVTLSQQKNTLQATRELVGNRILNID